MAAIGEFCVMVWIQSIWPGPFQHRRLSCSFREEMLVAFSLGNDLVLVDFTGRLFRDGKAVISAELSGIFERLGSMPRAGGPGSRS